MANGIFIIFIYFMLKDTDWLKVGRKKLKSAWKGSTPPPRVACVHSAAEGGTLPVCVAKGQHGLLNCMVFVRTHPHLVRELFLLQAIAPGT